MLEQRRIFLLIICFAALCLSTAPASASLFDFSFTGITSSYDGVDEFIASVNKNPGSTTSGNVTRQESPTSVAYFFNFGWLTLPPSDFSLEMALTNITAGYADGIGSFVITDIDGDTIIGDIMGTWVPTGTDNTFAGTMSNVRFIDTGTPDGSFDGHLGSVQMDFISSPWCGTLIELSSGGTWFYNGDYDSAAGGVTASVVGPQSVPVPVAVLLGIIGLGVAGLKLRKYA